MTKYIYSILSTLLLIGLIACNEEKSAKKGQGYLYLGVEKNVTMVTKAVNPTLSVAILDAVEDTVKYFADFEKEQGSEGLLLDAGAYQIVVSASKRDTAAWELPYFYGETECEIVENQVTSAKVTCKIANTKVTVDYSDDFKKYFTDFSTTVSNVSGSLTYKMGETRGGFFAPEALKAKLLLTNKDGEMFELNREYPNVQERYHYTLRFKLEGDPDQPDDSGEAGGKFDITVEEKADTVYVNIPVRVEDLEAMKAPAFKLEGFDDNNTLEYKSGQATATTMALTIGNGIERLMLSVSSEQKNISVNLANLSENDKAQLSGIGFPIPETVKGEEELSFDFTEMSNALTPFDDKTPQTYKFAFTVRDNKSQEKQASFTYQVKPDVKLFTREIATANVWATFTYFTGEMEGEGELGFEYKKKADMGGWTKIPVASKNDDGITFTALVEGLDPHTEYEYRAVSADFEGNEINANLVDFTTDYANEDDNKKPFVLNLSFDDWCTDGGVNYPSKDLKENRYWDSGNEGTKSAGSQPTIKETSIVKSGSAVKLETNWISMLGGLIQKMAAGSLYTGYYYKTDIQNQGAELMFGRPCNGIRPTTLSGYYMYQPGLIDKASGDYSSLMNKKDSCHIYIVLTDWENPFHIISAKNQYVDLSEKNQSIIAFGELKESPEVSMTEYKPFTIKLKYRDKKEIRKPKKILIVATSSKYGDYFTGSTSSVLYVDEFSLGFDYDPDCFVGTPLQAK